ncbi:MAG: FHA domain-containing protein [Hyphomicrobium sp.]
MRSWSLQTWVRQRSLFFVPAAVLAGLASVAAAREALAVDVVLEARCGPPDYGTADAAKTPKKLAAEIRLKPVDEAPFDVAAIDGVKDPKPAVPPKTDPKGEPAKPPAADKPGSEKASDRPAATAPEKSRAGQVAATLSCDLRANDFVVFKAAKATLKGESQPLETTFEAFDPRTQSIASIFLIQILETNRRSLQGKMTDAVIEMTAAREGQRRYAAYSFGNDLNLAAGFGASKSEFDRQVRAIRPLEAKVQLYRAVLDAIAKLARETADRKALVILGDGTADDTAYAHDEVVKAAKDAGVVISTLGFYDDADERPNFQKLSRLARETKGFSTEVVQPGRDSFERVVSSRFAGELLENGGRLTIKLKAPPGTAAMEIAADFTDGRLANLEQSVLIDPPAGSRTGSQKPATDDATGRGEGDGVSISARSPRHEPGWTDGFFDWAEDNSAVALVIGAGLGLGLIGLMLFVYRGGLFAGGSGMPLLDRNGKPVAYGWLEMLDGNASRYPLQTTNVRIGRHRDNDICLRNDSISRRHAVLHFNSDTRRFVITDLGGGNGVVVNKSKFTTRELSDGDLVELGEVRLRFQADRELMG